MSHDGVSPTLIESPDFKYPDMECDYGGRSLKMFIVRVVPAEMPINLTPPKYKIPFPSLAYSKKRGRKKW